MFSESERNIFKYHNGIKEVFADPMTLHRRMFTVFDGNPWAAIEAATPKQAPTPGEPENPIEVLGRLEAEEKLVAGIRQMFKLPDFNEETGEGATESTCWKIWNSFHEFIQGEDNGAASLPIGSAPTDSLPAPSTSETSSLCG